MVDCKLNSSPPHKRFLSFFSHWRCWVWVGSWGGPVDVTNSPHSVITHYVPVYDMYSNGATEPPNKWWDTFTTRLSIRFGPNKSILIHFAGVGSSILFYIYYLFITEQQMWLNWGWVFTSSCCFLLKSLPNKRSQILHGNISPSAVK